MSRLGTTLIGFNNHPDTTVENVRAILEEVLERARRGAVSVSD